MAYRLATFRVGGCPIKVNDCSISRVGNCYIRVLHIKFSPFYACSVSVVHQNNFWITMQTKLVILHQLFIDHPIFSGKYKT